MTIGMEMSLQTTFVTFDMFPGVELGDHMLVLTFEENTIEFSTDLPSQQRCTQLSLLHTLASPSLLWLSFELAIPAGEK